MGAQRFHFTQHALERYVQRHAKHLSIAEAQRQLEEAAPHATRLRAKTFAGQTQWQVGGDPAVTLVTKEERGTNVVVTILPDLGGLGLDDEQRAEMNEASVRREAYFAHQRALREVTKPSPEESERRKLRSERDKAKNECARLEDENRRLRAEVERLRGPAQQPHAVVPPEFNQGGRVMSANESDAVSEYHAFVDALSAVHADLGDRERLLFAAVGLSEEAGEVLGVMKKACWHGRAIDHGKLIEEAGDTLWYLTYLCNALGVSLLDLIAANTAKLRKRYPDGYSHAASAARADVAAREAESRPSETESTGRASR